MSFVKSLVQPLLLVWVIPRDQKSRYPERVDLMILQVASLTHQSIKDDYGTAVKSAKGGTVFLSSLVHVGGWHR
jgi:hypothetical protein